MCKASFVAVDGALTKDSGENGREGVASERLSS